MSGPTFATTAFKWDQRQVIKFGNLAVPVTGQTLGWIDLNDQVSWFAQDVVIDNSHISNRASQATWRGRGLWTAQDFVGRKVTVPMYYDEGGASTSFAQAKAQLTQASEQYLTFDNVTGLRVRVNSFAQSKFYTPFPPYIIETGIEFLSRNPFAEDLVATTTSSTPISGSVSPGTATNFTISYAGAVFGGPTYTVTIPNTNTAPISQVILANTDSGETLTASFSPALSASNAHSVVIDSTNLLVTVDGNNLSSAPTGSYPQLYPGFPGPFTNHFTVTLFTSSGTTTGVTINAQYRNRWEI